MNESAFKGALSDALVTVANGKDVKERMNLDFIEQVISSVLPDCSDKEFNALMSMLYDDNGSDEWKYDDMIEYGYLVLQQQREAAAVGGGQ